MNFVIDFRRPHPSPFHAPFYHSLNKDVDQAIAHVGL
jgi:hypothetical protein